jgi:hypothetical protein
MLVLIAPVVEVIALVPRQPDFGECGVSVVV